MKILAFDLSLTASGRCTADGPAVTWDRLIPPGLRDIARMDWIAKQCAEWARGADLLLMEDFSENLTGLCRRTWQKLRLFSRGPRYYKIYDSIRYDLEEVVACIKTLTVTVSRASDAKKLHHDQFPAAGLRGRR